MKSFVAAAMAGLFATLATAQSGSFETWIRTRYAEPARVGLQQVLRDAGAAGLVSTPTSARALKAALQAVRCKARNGRVSFRTLETAPASALPQLGVDALMEHEFNDSWLYADEFSGSAVQGDCTVANDVDVWHFASVGGFYTVDVTGAGGPLAATDTILTIRNRKGDVVAVNDISPGSSLSQVNLYLPAGDYYAEVTSFLGVSGGLYNLSITHDPVHMVPLGAAASGTTRAPAGLVAHDVFELQVPESRVLLQVASNLQDTMLVVQRADGVVVFSDDDTSTGVDAGADIDLPAGRYFVYVSEVFGTAGVPFSIQSTVSAGALPSGLNGQTFASALAGNESMRLVRFDLSAGAATLDILTDGAPTVGVNDTVLSLLDRDLDFLCDVDDDAPSDPLRGYYSRIRVSLPAGVYYAAVTPYPFNTGSFTLTATTSAFAPTGPLAFGPVGQPAAIAGGGMVNSYAVENLTQTSAVFTGSDYWYSFVGPDGELASCQRGSQFQPQGGEVPTGGGYMLVWDRFDYAGGTSLSVAPALAYDGTSVVSRAKEGDFVIYLAEFGIVPGPAFNFGVGDRGFLLLPQTPYLVTLDLRMVDPTGRVSWWTPPTFPYLVMLQTLDLHLGNVWQPPALLTWRNLLRL